MQDDDPRALLSRARTSLDDPAGLYPEQTIDDNPVSQSMRDSGYPDHVTAIHYIDEAMASLDAELRPKRALTTVGRIIAELADNPDTRSDLAATLHEAVDRLDEVIAAISTDPHDD